MSQIIFIRPFKQNNKTMLQVVLECGDMLVISPRKMRIHTYDDIACPKCYRKRLAAMRRTFHLLENKTQMGRMIKLNRKMFLSRKR